MQSKSSTSGVSYRLITTRIVHRNSDTRPSHHSNFQKAFRMTSLLQKNMSKLNKSRVSGVIKSARPLSATDVNLLQKIMTSTLTLHSTKTGLVVWYPIVCGFRKLWLLILPLTALLLQSTFGSKHLHVKAIRGVFKDMEVVRSSLTSCQRLQIFRTILTSGLSHCGTTMDNCMDSVVVLDLLQFRQAIQTYFKPKLYSFNAQIIEQIRKRVCRQADENDMLWKPCSATLSPQFDQVAFGLEWKPSHVRRVHSCIEQHHTISPFHKQGHIRFHKRKQWFIAHMHYKRKLIEIE